MDNEYPFPNVPDLREPAQVLADTLLHNIVTKIDQVTRSCGRFEEYSDLNKFTYRAETFYTPGKKWKSVDNLSAVPTNFAEAGFHYFGFQDLVQCFKCKGCLVGWSGNYISPWDAHIAWFPHCPFVKLHHSTLDISFHRGRLATIQNAFHFKTYKLPIDFHKLIKIQRQVFGHNY